MTDNTKILYRPRDIAAELGAEHSAGSLASTVAAFWPTIKAALLAYDKTNPKPVEPIKQDW